MLNSTMSLSAMSDVWKHFIEMTFKLKPFYYAFTSNTHQLVWWTSIKHTVFILASSRLPTHPSVTFHSPPPPQKKCNVFHQSRLHGFSISQHTCALSASWKIVTGEKLNKQNPKSYKLCGATFFKWWWWLSTSIEVLQDENIAPYETIYSAVLDGLAKL